MRITSDEIKIKVLNALDNSEYRMTISQIVSTVKSGKLTLDASVSLISKVTNALYDLEREGYVKSILVRLARTETAVYWYNCDDTKTPIKTSTKRKY